MDSKEKTSALPEGAYLTEEQIATIRTRVEEATQGKEGETEILKLLGDFVRANGRLDEAFSSLEKLAGEVLDLVASDIPYPEHVRMALIPVSLLTYFNLLLLTGVYKEDEMSVSMKEISGEKGHRDNEA